MVQKYEQTLNDNESLRKQLTELNEELKDKRGKLQVLEGELRAAKIARGVASSSEDTDLAKAKISTLVREIDRCIALLNE